MCRYGAPLARSDFLACARGTGNVGMTIICNIQRPVRITRRVYLIVDVYRLVEDTRFTLGRYSNENVCDRREDNDNRELTWSPPASYRSIHIRMNQDP